METRSLLYLQPSQLHSSRGRYLGEGQRPSPLPLCFMGGKKPFCRDDCVRLAGRTGCQTPESLGSRTLLPPKTPGLLGSGGDGERTGQQRSVPTTITLIKQHASPVLRTAWNLPPPSGRCRPRRKPGTVCGVPQRVTTRPLCPALAPGRAEQQTEGDGPVNVSAVRPPPSGCVYLYKSPISRYRTPAPSFQASKAEACHSRPLPG